jgi:hypothetical protein
VAVPTITSISPSVGHTGGLNAVEIIGTGFQTWTIPPSPGHRLPPPWPTVEVLFNGVPGTEVAVVSPTRLYVRVPTSPLVVASPSFSEGAVAVTVRNLSRDGAPIAGETTTVPDLYSYARAQLSIETDFARLCRQVLLLFKQNVIDNVSATTHSDFDLDVSDMLNVVDVAKVPAIVIFGPTLIDNRFYSVNGRQNYPVSETEGDRYSPPDTDDLLFTLVAITDLKNESLSLMSQIKQLFKRHRWLQFARDPNNPAAGFVKYDMQLDASGLAPLAPADGKSNLHSFSASFVVRGFNHEDLAGFENSDRVGRVFRVLPDPPPTPVEAKTIVSFAFPFGIGVVGDGTISVTVPHGTDVTGLTPLIAYNGASISPASGVPADFTSPQTYTVIAVDGSTKDYVVTVNVAAAVVSSAMSIGTNFWYHTSLDDNYSGETSRVAGIDWSTAYGAAVGGLADTNIWEPTWLAELAPYSTLRFMDWGNTNYSQIVTWAQRMQPTDPNNYAVYIDGLSPPNNPGVAYEWMIDLCNRVGKDLWVCLPAKSNSNYWLQLATLIKAKLSPDLRVYVEYSNETWNGQFSQFQWTIDQGVALGLPGSNQYYQGQAYALVQSLKIFEQFENVFGSAAMGVQVLRVFSYGGNMDTGRLAFRNVYDNALFPPAAQRVDRLAIAPYIGSELDGSAPTIQTLFHAAIAAVFADQVTQAIADKAEFSIPKLITYEGGQQLFTNSAVWSANAAIYDEYTHMLDLWGDHFALFMHYTHTGKWTNVLGSSSWGAKDHTGQDPAAAHKYRALRDWVAAHP